MTSTGNHQSIPNELLTLSEKRQRWVNANEENEFGEGIRNLLTELYPENAHFIVELLQNAEDAKATTVEFHLREDRLLFEHDGKVKFSYPDIESITSIGVSTKRNDPTAIGKFGVGFKAVFAYTECPEIHSGEYHFRIRDLVVPDATDVELVSIGDKTLFVFPFNHRKKTNQQALAEIERGLLNLSDNTLLFLKNIEALHFSLPDGGKGSLRRLPPDNGRIEIQVCRPYDPESNDRDAESVLPLKVDQLRRSNWLRFGKIVQVIDPEDSGKAKSCEISIAYSLERRETTSKKSSPASSRPSRNPLWRIVPIESGEVSIYFPAVKETSKLRFHMHAPFASTVARDSVRECDVNDELRDHLAELVADSLTAIRDMGFLTVDFLEVLPLPNDNLSSFYVHFRERVVEQFRRSPLTPTRSGRHSKAGFLRRAPNELTSRLGDRELTCLSKCELLRWAANPKQYSREDQFLSSLGVGEWGFRELAEAASKSDRSIVSQWLEAKSDEWIQQLYVALHRQKNPWARQTVKLYPIVRLQDGCHVDIATPRLFLSQGSHPYKDVRVVSSKVVENEDAKAFLLSLDIKEFDLGAAIKEFVLPKYCKPLPDVPFNEHKIDITQIISVYPEITKELREAKLVLCDNVTSGKSEFKLGRECYLESEPLRCYFDGNPDAWFVSSKYDEFMNDDLRTLFKSIGAVTERPRRWNTDQYRVRAAFKRDDHERGLQGFNPRWDIEGLRYALSNPSLERSAYIWNTLLADSTHLISGVVEECPVESFPSARVTQKHCDSVAGSLLKSIEWIPDSKGTFQRARTIGSTANLHESLVANAQILAALDEGAAETKQALSDAFGIGAEKLEETRSAEQAKQAFLGYISKSSGSSERRAAGIRTQEPGAKRRALGTRNRKVRIGRVSSDDVFNYLGTFYIIDDRWHCQMCCYPMQFRKRNGDECHEKRELFSGRWALKRGLVLTDASNQDRGPADRLPEYEKLYVVLCPLCNSIFNEYVLLADEHQDALLEWMRNDNGKVFTVPCSKLNPDERDRELHFHQKHIDDLRSIRVIRPEEVARQEKPIES